LKNRKNRRALEAPPLDHCNRPHDEFLATRLAASS